MRFITDKLPYLYGKLPANLRGLLDGQGIDHLNNGIPGGSYTIAQAAPRSPGSSGATSLW